MTKPTGRPPGRPRGLRNKKTVEGFERGAKAVAEALAHMPGQFQGDAHAFLVTVYKDPSHSVQIRLAAATSAIKFEKPALQAIDMTSQNEHVVHTISDKPVDREGEDWLKEHAAPTSH